MIQVHCTSDKYYVQYTLITRALTYQFLHELKLSVFFSKFSFSPLSVITEPEKFSVKLGMHDVTSNSYAFRNHTNRTTIISAIHY